MMPVIFLILAGILLPFCGSQLQLLWKNQLGDIYSLGLGSAACLGASLSALLGLSMFTGSYMCCIILTLLVALLYNKLTIEKLLTLGMLLGSFVGAIGTIVANNCTPEALQQYYRWAGASFNIQIATYQSILALVYIAVGVLVIYIRYEDSRSVFIGISLVVSSIISVCGVIGMISLTAPNVARIAYKGESKRVKLWLPSLIGLSLLSITYLVTEHCNFGIYLPISATMSIIALPLVVYTLKS